MRTMKKTIAFVLAFAMTFATAFSAVSRVSVYADGEGTEETTEAPAGDTTEETTEAPAGDTTEETTEAPAEPTGEFSVSRYEDGDVVFTGAQNYYVGVATVNKKGVASVKSWMPANDGYVTPSDIGVKPNKDAIIAVKGLKLDGTYTDVKFIKISKNANKKYVAVATPYTAKAEDIPTNGKVLRLYGEDEGRVFAGMEVYKVEIHAGSKTGTVVDTYYYAIKNSSYTDTITVLGDVKNEASTTKVSYAGKDDIVVIDGGTSNSNAVKVSLKAPAAAPAASVNFKTGKYVVPAKCEYRFVKSNEGAWVNGDWTTASSKVNADLEVTKGVLEVRKAATDNKVSSKVKAISFDKFDGLDVEKTEGEGVDVVVTSAEGKIKVTNKTKLALEYAFSAAKPTKFKNLKAEKDASVKIKSLTGMKLWIRIAGDAGSSMLPSEFAEYDFFEAFAPAETPKEVTPAAKTKLDVVINTETAGKVTVTLKNGDDVAKDVKGTVQLKSGDDNVVDPVTLAEGVATIEAGAGDYTVEVTVTGDKYELNTYNGAAKIS